MGPRGGRSGAVSTFTSEVEDSKEKNKWGEGRQGRRFGPASGPTGWVGVGKKVGTDGRRAQSQGSPTPARLLQIVTTTPAIGGDFPENSEHGVPDSVSQSWDVIWCQPFCGHWGQHPHLTLSRGEAALLLAVEVLVGGHDYGDNGNLGLHCKMEGATFEGQHGAVVVSRSLRKHPDPHVLGEQGLGDLRHDTDGIPRALPVDEDDSCQPAGQPGRASPQ